MATSVGISPNKVMDQVFHFLDRNDFYNAREAVKGLPDDMWEGTFELIDIREKLYEMDCEPVVTMVKSWGKFFGIGM